MMGKGRSHLVRRVREYLHHKELMAGTIILGIYVLIGLAAWAYYRGGLSYLTPDLGVYLGYHNPVPPTLTLYPFSLGSFTLGQTGGLGFSVAEGLVKGTPWDLMLFAGILVPTTLLGLVVGVIAGGSGGLVDDALMTVTDVVLSIPPFVVALLVFVVILPGIASNEIPLVFVASMVLINWAPYARLSRAKAKTIAAKPFVEAAAAAGANKGRILFRHVLPNSVSPVLSQVPITLSNLIILLTVIPYVGIVTSQQYLHILSFMPSTYFPEWTWILVNGMLGWHVSFSSNAWWGYVIPFLWIFVFGLSVLLFCDGLEDFLSPQSGSQTH
jgi:peptide/nickel transport system permease protein